MNNSPADSMLYPAGDKVGRVTETESMLALILHATGWLSNHTTQNRRKIPNSPN